MDAVARARAYPYRAGPARPEAFALGGGCSGPGPLLVAFGANAAPDVLAAKLGPQARVSAAPATLVGFDVAYSAHVAPYGAIPAALVRSPGTSVAVHVLRLEPGALPPLDATEGNYERAELAGGLEAYVSRHGVLCPDGHPVALAAVPARGRRLPELTETEMLERVRALLDPGADPEEFVRAQACDTVVARERSAALGRWAMPWTSCAHLYSPERSESTT